MSGSRSFDALFDAHATRVRRRLAARTVLTGAAIGLAVGAVGAACLYAVQRTGVAHPLHHPLARAFRPAFGVLAIFGAVAGWLVARRRRPSDESVALFLDARYGAQEAITTAVDGRCASTSPNADDTEGALSAVVLKRATDVLERAPSNALRLRPVQRRHALGPLLAGALVAVALLPVAPPVVAPHEPGSEVLGPTEIRGLDALIEDAATIDPRDEAQRERLERIAAEAKALREKARKGAPQREIQADVAKLAEQIAKERLSLGDGEERAGFEAAMRELEANGSLDGAARALGDRDLAKLDEEMQRLANEQEKASRDKAKASLRKAAEAARKNGAESVAKALEDQARQLERGGARADELRALRDAMEKSGLADKLRAAGKDAPPTDPRSAKALAEALQKALEGLSPDEKKKLAENLAKLAEQAAKSGAPNADELKKLAEAATDPEALAKRMKELARMDLESGEAKRNRELGGAGGRLEGQPVPVPGSASGGGAGQPGSADPGGSGGESDPGPTPKSPSDPTKPIAGGDLVSKANLQPGSGTPLESRRTSRTGSRPGDTANRVGTGALGDASADEIGGVQRSDIPESYRAHVGKYFQP